MRPPLKDRTGPARVGRNERQRSNPITMPSTKQRLRMAALIAALTTLALALSCTGFFPPEQLGTITIEPAAPTVPLGGTTQLHAYGTNTDNTPAGDITGKVTWSSNSGTVSVSSGGLLTGNDLSTTPATITANYQTISATASATVCVENGTNPKINFNPSNTVVEDTSVTMTVTMSVAGINEDVTSGVTWSTNNNEVTVTAGDPSTVDTSGLGTITSNVTVIIFGTYTCNGINTNFQANLTVEP